MDKYIYIKKLFKLTDVYNHSIDTEFMAYQLTQHYLNKNDNVSYSKDLAYVTTIIAAKINEEGGGYKSLNYNRYDLYELEKEVIKATLHFNIFNNIINDINAILVKNHCYKRLSPSFIFLLRYMMWCGVNTNLYTFVFAVQILKKYKQSNIINNLKYYKVYLILNDLSYVTGYNVNTLITEYNNIYKNDR